ncbi:hypothetical protein ACWGKS_13315 [Nocardiopsis sp. NPDC055879]
MVNSGCIIGSISKRIEFAYILIEAEEAREGSDHGDWDSESDAVHLLAGSLAVAVRVPMEGEVSLQVIEGVQADDLLPIPVFSGSVGNNSGRFVVSDPLDTFCIKFFSSGIFEVRVDEHQAARVQVIVR